MSDIHEACLTVHNYMRIIYFQPPTGHAAPKVLCSVLPEAHSTQRAPSLNALILWFSKYHHYNNQGKNPAGDVDILKDYCRVLWTNFIVVIKIHFFNFIVKVFTVQMSVVVAAEANLVPFSRIYGTDTVQELPYEITDISNSILVVFP